MGNKTSREEEYTSLLSPSRRRSSVIFDFIDEIPANIEEYNEKMRNYDRDAKIVKVEKFGRLGNADKKHAYVNLLEREH